MNFISPEEFVESAKQSLQDDYFSKIFELKGNHKEAFETRDLGFIKFLNNYYDHRVKNFFGLIKDVLPFEKNLFVSQQVAIGAILRGTMNAWIRKGDAFCYGILINTALLDAIARSFRYEFARRNKEMVLFVEKDDGKLYSESDYIKFQEELFLSFHNYGLPVGPGLIMDENHPETFRLTHYLNTADVFIISHELAHYLNGDFKRRTTKETSSNFNGYETIEGFAVNEELEADFVASIITAGVVNKHFGLEINHEFQIVLEMLFTTLDAIEPQKSGKYLRPLDRYKYLMSRIEI